MPFMDRESFIRLLNSLGDPDDATVLTAARTIDARMREAAIAWDDLLVPPTRAPVDADPAMPDEEHVAEAYAMKAGGPEDAALIDRLLAEYEMSDQTRQDLLDLKGDIAAGEYTAGDADYVRHLAGRLRRMG